MLRAYFLIFIIQVLFVFNSLSQEYLYKGSKEYRTAVRSFNDKNFSEALPLFKKLLNKYSKDPSYHYYTGACMAYCNVDIPQAIEYLQYASAKSVPYNVYFFLAKAYQLEGQFQNAIKYYNRFNAYAKRNEKEEYKTNMLISQCNTGIELITNSKNNILNSQISFAKKYLESYLNKLSIGNFFHTSVDIASKSPDGINKIDLTNFIPSKTLINDQFYIHGIDDIKNGLDILIATKESDDTWKKIKNIGNVINTQYDEAYPFYDEKNKILFFSNNGPKSMGGYDIFYSKYNKERDIWMPPVNLGSNFNSPSDDYFFLLKNDKEAYFISNRNIHTDSVGLFAVKYVNGNIQLNSSEVQAEFSKSLSLDQPESKEDNIIVDSQAVEIEIDVEEDIQEFNLDEDLKLSYDELINKALRYQIQSDSIYRESKVVREEMNKMTTPQEKSPFYKRVKQLEARSAEIQARADILYQQAREQELSEVKNQAFLYTQSNLSEEKDKENKQNKSYSKVSENTDKESAVKEENEIQKLINTFSILDASPYSEDNPIPLDITFTEGIIYRLQLGAFSKQITWDKFGGLTPLTGEVIPERNITKYYVGLFTNTKQSQEALAKVREYGYKDAFIVSYFNGKKISIQRARDIESTLTN